MCSFETLILLIEKRFKIKIDCEMAEKARPFFREEHFQKDDIILQIGDISKYVYFVIKGILREYYIDIDGNDKTKNFIPEGSISCGEILINNEPSLVCIESLEDCTLMAINCRDLRNLIDNNLLYLKVWSSVLESGMEYKIMRENSFLMKSATERYVDFNIQFPSIESRVNQKYIASYLGITPVSLSRIRRAIKEETKFCE